MVERRKEHAEKATLPLSFGKCWRSMNNDWPEDDAETSPGKGVPGQTLPEAKE